MIFHYPFGYSYVMRSGSVANAIVLMQDAHTIEMKSTLIGMIALIYFITFLILRASTRWLRFWERLVIM